MKFYTKYDRPERINYEVNSGIKEVVTAGFRPLSVMIKEFHEAGKQLISNREARYDFQPGQKVDMNINPAPNFIDPADVMEAQEQASEGLQEAFNEASQVNTPPEPIEPPTDDSEQSETPE
jgi:hypothetical protein